MSTQNPFQKASRSQVFLKLAITGPTGSGKTLSALRMAKGLIESGQRIAFEDTENDSASLYADLTEAQCKALGIPDPIEFDVMPIAPPFEPESFSDGINAAVNAGYGVVIIDSASHFWKGILAYKDQLDGHGGTNKFANWKKADEKFDPVIESVLQSKIHVIFCMRSKISYEMDEQTKKVSKVGLAPIMRESLEYEFTTVFDIGQNHTALSSKDRSGLFPNDKPFVITEQTGRDLAAWLKTAKPKPEAPLEPTPEQKAEDERQKRIKGRQDAAEKERNPHVSGAEWQDAYATAACVMIRKDDPAFTDRPLSEFTTEQLKATTLKHDVIITALKDGVAKGAAK